MIASTNYFMLPKPIIRVLMGLMLLFGMRLQAQSGTAIVVNVYPNTAQITLDGQRVPHSGATVSVDPGPHRIQAIAPKFSPLDTLVTVTVGDTLQFNRVMHYSDDWVSHQIATEKFKQRKGKVLGWGIGTLAMGGLTLAGNLAYNSKLETEQWLLENTIADYHVAIGQGSIEQLKATYEAQLEDYNRTYANRKLVTTVGLGLTGVAGIVTLYHFIRYKTDKPPRYETGDMRMGRLQFLAPPIRTAGLGFTYSF